MIGPLNASGDAVDRAWTDGAPVAEYHRLLRANSAAGRERSVSTLSVPCWAMQSRSLSTVTCIAALLGLPPVDG
jgi:hypothetical protein